MGKPEVDEDTPGKAYVYFTAMVRENQAAGLVDKECSRCANNKKNYVAASSQTGCMGWLGLWI